MRILRLVIGLCLLAELAAGVALWQTWPHPSKPPAIAVTGHVVIQHMHIVTGTCPGHQGC
jgi:hypothetical protein